MKLGAQIKLESGVHDRALAHRHATLTEVVRDDGLKNLLTQPMLLLQVAEGEDLGLFRDPVTDQLDACKAAYGGHLN